MVEFRELSLALSTGAFSPKNRVRLENKCRELATAHWSERRRAILAGLDADQKARLDADPLARLMSSTPAFAVAFDFMNTVENQPELLARPGSLRASFHGMLATVVDAEDDLKDSLLLPWIRQRRNYRDFHLNYHAERMQHLIDQPRIRALHHLFCDSWRRGSDPRRHLDIRESCIATEEYCLLAPLIASRHAQRAHQVSHPEEKIDAWSRAIHSIVELGYKSALVALYRLEFGRDDKIPGHARQLGLQLAARWRSRGLNDYLSLIDLDALIIRNAVAHQHIEHPRHDQVVFESRSNTSVDSVGPLTAAELEERFESLMALLCDIANAFNFIMPFLNRDGLVRLR